MSLGEGVEALVDSFEGNLVVEVEGEAERFLIGVGDGVVPDVREERLAGHFEVFGFVLF